MRAVWLWGRHANWVVGGLAVTIGCLLPVLPTPAQLTLLLAATLPVVMMVTRSSVHLYGWRRAGSASRDDSGPVVVASDSRLVRWLTYLGFGTLALLTLRPTPALTVSDWIFLGALVVALLEYSTKSHGVNLSPPRPMFVGATLVLIGALLSLPNAADGTESLAVVARFVYLTVGWFALARYALRTTRDVSAATQIWVASVALSGAAAVAQLLWGDIIPGTAIANGRMTGFAQHVTDLGGMCAIALIPAASFLDVHGYTVARRVAAAVLVALVAAGLMLSGSVDGFVAAAVGLAIWIWTGSVGRRAVGAMLGVAALFVIVSGAAVQLGLVLPGDRIFSVLLAGPDNPYASFYTRLAGFDQAWRAIGASPVFGVGFDPASATTITGDAVHNALLASWFEGGILALVGIVVILLAAAATAWRAWTGGTTPESRRLAAALLAAVGSAIAFSMGNPILFQRYIWAPVFLAIALVGHETRARVSASHVRPAVGGESVARIHLLGRRREVVDATFDT